MNPDCKRVRPLVSAYFDGETTAEEARIVREHLETCEDCRIDLEDYRRVRGQFTRLAHPTAPPELRRVVLTEIHAARTGAPSRRRSPAGLSLARARVLAGGLGALLVAVLLGIVFLVAGGNKNPAQQTQVAVATITIENNGDTRVTLSGPIKQQNLDVQVIDANGKVLAAEVSQVDNNTIDIKLPEGQNSAPDKPVKVIVNNGGQKQQITIAPPPATATNTRTAPTSTATNRPANTTQAIAATTAASTTAAPATTNAATTSVPTTAPATTSAPTTGAALTTSVPVTTTVNTPSIVAATPDPSSGPSTTITGTTAVSASPSVTSTTVPATTASATTAVPTTSVPSCTNQAGSSFEALYQARPDIARQIGCPSGAQSTATMAYENFANGFMLYNQATDRIYVLYRSGRYESFANSWREGDLITMPATNCAVLPARGFGKIWAINAAVRQGIGCAQAAENSSSQAATQSFANGTMFLYPSAANGKRIYVLFNDGSFLDVAG